MKLKVTLNWRFVIFLVIEETASPGYAKRWDLYYDFAISGDNLSRII